MVRGKFRLTQVTSYAGYSGQKFVFSPTQAKSIPEDANFAKYTPNGKLEMTVDNPPAQSQFTLGEYYWLDLTPCPATAP